MKKSICFIILALVGCIDTYSQQLTRADVELRASYHYNSIGESVVNANTGFKGNYFQVLLSGNITNKLRFDIRQKLNKYSESSSFFDATDKALLIYNPIPQCDIKVGKRPLSIGGCDYAIIPIDLYFTGQYCDLLTIYQWGASIGYTLNNKKDSFIVEVTQSPFRTYSSNPNIYAFTALWEGHHGVFDFLHSVHFFGTESEKYINWIMLGHRINLGKVIFEADVLNKYSISKEGIGRNKFFFSDFSVVGKVIYNPIKKLSIAVKYCLDVNNCEYDSDEQKLLYNCDYHVLPGTQVNRLGGIIEYFPLKDKQRNTLRLHLTAYKDWGTNTNLDGTVINKQLFVTFGATLKLAFIKNK